MGDERPVDPPPPAEPERPARPPRPNPLAERAEVAVERDERALRAGSRRDFLLLGLGTVAAAVGAWWLLPDRTKARLLPGDSRARAARGSSTAR